VAEDLAALGGAPLDVRLNSPGGDLFEGIAVYNLLGRYAGKVTVHIDALAASIATVVAMAGDRIVIAPSALMMIHHASACACGDATSMRQMADALERSDQAIFGTYAARSGRKMASFLQRVTAAGGEWWISPAEATKEGLADEVLDEKRPEKMAALLDASFRMVPRELAAQAPTWVRPSGNAQAGSFVELCAPRRRLPEVPEAAAVVSPSDPAIAAAAAARRVRQAQVAELGS